MHRNDQITVDAIAALRPTHIVISPGPGRPEDAGISVDVLRRFGPAVPILGVCLGHQAIGHAFGGRVVRVRPLMHGKTSDIPHDGQGVFRDIPRASPPRATSLVVSPEGLPDELEITAAHDRDGTVMAVRHRHWPVHGVQFHPESVLTDAGRHLLRNFLEGLMFARLLETLATATTSRPTRPMRDGSHHARRGDAGADCRLADGSASKGSGRRKSSVSRGRCGDAVRWRAAGPRGVRHCGTGGDGPAPSTSRRRWRW